MERRSSVKSPDSVFIGGLEADTPAGLMAATRRTDSRLATLSGGGTPRVRGLSET